MDALIPIKNALLYIPLFEREILLAENSSE